MEVRVRHVDQTTGVVIGTIPPMKAALDQVLGLFSNSPVWDGETDIESPTVLHQIVVTETVAYVEVLLGGEG